MKKSFLFVRNPLIIISLKLFNNDVTKKVVDLALPDNLTIQKMNYTLVGYISHVGVIGFGHYTYSFKDSHNNWVTLDDKILRECSDTDK